MADCRLLVPTMPRRLSAASSTSCISFRCRRGMDHCALPCRPATRQSRHAGHCLHPADPANPKAGCGSSVLAWRAAFAASAQSPRPPRRQPRGYPPRFVRTPHARHRQPSTAARSINVLPWFHGTWLNGTILVSGKRLDPMQVCFGLPQNCTWHSQYYLCTVPRPLKGGNQKRPFSSDVAPQDTI